VRGTTAGGEISWRARLSLAAFGVLLAIGTAEGALRAGHFHFDLVPVLEFGWPDPVALRDAYAADADLVWVTRDYHETLRAAQLLRPAIVFMGDSCTEFGTYPSRTLAALASAGMHFTGVKLGVGGWSSAQGLAQLRRDVIPLHPHVITVYFGWNDHWKAIGLTDPEVMRTRRLRLPAGHPRLAPPGSRRSSSPRRRITSPGTSPPTWPGVTSVRWPNWCRCTRSTSS